MASVSIQAKLCHLASSSLGWPDQERSPWARSGCHPKTFIFRCMAPIQQDYNSPAIAVLLIKQSAQHGNLVLVWKPRAQRHRVALDTQHPAWIKWDVCNGATPKRWLGQILKVAMFKNIYTWDVVYSSNVWDFLEALSLSWCCRFALNQSQTWNANFRSLKIIFGYLSSDAVSVANLQAWVKM